MTVLVQLNFNILVSGAFLINNRLLPFLYLEFHKNEMEHLSSLLFLTEQMMGSDIYTPTLLCTESKRLQRRDDLKMVQH